MNKNQFFNRNSHLNVDRSEIERKWRVFQEEQEFLMMAEAARQGRGGAIIPSPGGGSGSLDQEVIYSLTLSFDNISSANTLVGDYSNVEDWNVFFDLPNLGTPFTGVEVLGDDVILTGGRNIKVKPSLMYPWVDNIFLIKIIDTGCITSVGGDAFSYCDGLTDVILPNCSIVYGWDDSPDEDWGGFGGCVNLANLSVPNLLTAGKGAFPECISLLAVNFPKLTSAGNQCFSSCSGLTTVNLPLVASIGAECFSQCTSLESISMPLCTNLGGTFGNDSVFGGINGNTINVVINNSVLTDADLIDLSINNSITVNGGSYQPFSGFSGDLSITFDDIASANALVGDASDVNDWNTFFNLPSWSVEFTSVNVSGRLITLLGGENIVMRDNLFQNNVTIDEIQDTGCVVYLGYQCFQGCSALDPVALPAVIYLGDSCFSSCTALTSINAEALQYIGNSCFSSCISINSISFPLITSLGSGVFIGCYSLDYVNLPELLTSGGSNFQSCLLLQTIDTPKVVSFGPGDFQGCTYIQQLITFPDLQTIGNNGFFGCTSLAQIALPSLISIGESCFENCTSLGNIFNLPELSIIGNRAFRGCSAIQTVSMPKLEIAGDQCFAQCSQLYQIEFPSLLELGSECFTSTNLQGVLNLSTVTTIGNGCFSGCQTLYGINLDVVKDLGDNCFLNCGGLIGFSAPLLENIGNNCFEGATSFTDFNFPSVLTIGDECFKSCTNVFTFNLPMCTNLGTSVGDNGVFNGISGRSIALTVPAALTTCNSGNPDGDIQYLQANNSVVVITT